MSSRYNPARALCPCPRAVASVPLSVHSESFVDEDSWTTFSDVSSEVEKSDPCRLMSMRLALIVDNSLFPLPLHWESVEFSSATCSTELLLRPMLDVR
ncbi:hypothetical protein Tco_0407732 [Tanacetum coccineum]